MCFLPPTNTYGCWMTAGPVLAWALVPLDLLPDFIPILGYLDDALIVPGLIAVAVWLISREMLKRCRRQSSGI